MCSVQLDAVLVCRLLCKLLTCFVWRSVYFCGNVEVKAKAVVITSRPVLKVNGFSAPLPQLPGLKTVELPTLRC